MTTKVAGPIAGWYPDPSDGGRIRYWDGTRWTDHVQERSVAADTPAVADRNVADLDSETKGVDVDSLRVAERLQNGDEVLVADAPPSVNAAGQVSAPSPPPPPPPSTQAAPGPPPPSTQAAPGPPPPSTQAAPGPPPPSTQAAPPRPSTPTSTIETSTPPPPAPIVGQTSAPPVALSRGPHYVVEPGAARVQEGLSLDDEQGYLIVTGQVPLGYSRVSVECEGGDVVQATLLPAPSGEYRVFAAPVRHPVERVVATRRGGVQGIFFDVASLEQTGDDEADAS